MTLGMLRAAQQVDLDMSAEEARETLRRGGFSIEQEVDLPPTALNRIILAVPRDDECMPRAAEFVCPAVRVVLLNDPQRGFRVVRVEAYERAGSTMSVASMFELAAASMGPPLQTEMWPEQVRGGAVVVWRQRWREGITEGPLTEIFVTQDAPTRQGLGLPNPNETATGVGYVRADLETEGAFASVRRRLRSGAGSSR